MDRIFELHHVDPSQKAKNYDNLIRQVISERQLDEIDKCVLLCRNCHGVAEAQKLRVTLEITSKIRWEGRVTEKTGTWNGFCVRSNGLLIRYTFITNEPCPVVPYTIQRGGRAPTLIWSLDLEQIYQQSLDKIAELKVVTIRTLSGEQMLTIQTDPVHGSKIEQSIRFPFAKFELPSSDGTTLWIRNGIALTNTGEWMTDGIVTCLGVARGSANN